MVEVNMPYPPSGNHIWKHTRAGKHYLTEEARAFFSKIRFIVSNQGYDIKLDSRLHVVCRICPPDKRKRDLDNVWKVVSDSMTKAGVWVDDCQIDKLELHRLPSNKPGFVTVFVYPLP
jgi:crossover junction endodeoxyribonuclease RusA